MKKLSIARSVCAAGLAAACVWGLAGCSSDGSKLTGGVAATVNGVEISEDDITLTIESIRTSLDVTDAESWGTWMSENGYTPEQVREEVLDGFIDQEILRQGAAEMGITVEESEIDSYYEQIASQFETEEDWQAALESAGYASEDEYRETIELSLLSEGVQATFATDEEPAAEDMLSYAQMYATYYDGAKRSSHILFDTGDEATAQEVLDKINAGTLDFAAAAEEYSKDTGSAAQGGDVGWDALTTFVDEYQAGLDALSVGEISGLVTSEYGIHIITCTDEFSAPAEVTSVDQLPTEFVDSIRSMLQSSMQSEAYDNWLTEQREAADIVINDIPADVSYYVDMTQYAIEEEATDESTDESDEVVDDSSTDEDTATEDTADTSGETAAE